MNEIFYPNYHKSFRFKPSILESDDDLIQQTGSSKKRKNFSSVNREDENRQHFKRSKNIEDINANG